MSKIAVLVGSGAAVSHRHVVDGARDATLRALACNDTLFKTGYRKTNVYHVESCALRLCRARRDGRTEVVEFAFPGDIVGLGFHDRHACSAHVPVETRVSCLPLDAADRISAGDARTAARHKDAVERECNARRDVRLAARGSPAIRLAAFLVALSRRNAFEAIGPLLASCWRRLRFSSPQRCYWEPDMRRSVGAARAAIPTIS